MTPFIPLADGAQAEIGYSLAGKTMENRLWFVKDNPPIVLSDLQGLADGLVNWHVNKVLPFLSTDIELLSVIAAKWDDHAGDIFAQTHANVLGSVASKSYSANVAVRINLRWPLQFRQRKNCNFLPGIPDNAISLNTVDLTWAENIWEAYADLIDDTRLFSPILNWRWMVTSYQDGGSFRTEQLAGECIGPVHWEFFRVAQRRKRLA